MYSGPECMSSMQPSKIPYFYRHGMTLTDPEWEMGGLWGSTCPLPPFALEFYKIKEKIIMKTQREEPKKRKEKEENYVTYLIDFYFYKYTLISFIPLSIIELKFEN